VQWLVICFANCILDYFPYWENFAIYTDRVCRRVMEIFAIYDFLITQPTRDRVSTLIDTTSSISGLARKSIFLLCLDIHNNIVTKILLCLHKPLDRQKFQQQDLTLASAIGVWKIISLYARKMRDIFSRCKNSPFKQSIYLYSLALISKK